MTQSPGLTKQKDILDRISSFMEIEEHPETKEMDVLALLSDAQAEIRGLRMVMQSRNLSQDEPGEAVYPHNLPDIRDVILSALNGSAALVVTRHDCPPDKMVRAAINIAKELKSQME